MIFTLELVFSYMHNEQVVFFAMLRNVYDFVISGQKYEFAKKWNVYCISIHWLFDSIEKGFCQDESRYAVEREDKRKEKPGRPNTSTPTGSNKSEDR